MGYEFTGQVLILLALLGGFALGKVAQRMPFDEGVQVFSEVGGVIAGAFKGLRHQKNFETDRLRLGGVIGKVLLEERVTDAVEFGIHAQNFASVFEFE